MGTVDLKHLLNWLNLHKCVNVCPAVFARLSVPLSLCLSVCASVCLCNMYLLPPLCNCCHFYCPGNVFCPPLWDAHAPPKLLFPIRTVCVCMCVCACEYTLPAPVFHCPTGCPLYSAAKQKFCRWFYWPIFGCVSFCFFQFLVFLLPLNASSFCMPAPPLSMTLPLLLLEPIAVYLDFFSTCFRFHKFFMASSVGFKVLLWFKHLLIVSAYVNRLGLSECVCVCLFVCVCICVSFLLWNCSD